MKEGIFMNLFNEQISVFGLITLIVLLLEGANYMRELFSPIDNVKFGKYMSWRRLNRLIKQLAQEITDSGNEYKMIVAPGRGGAICAGLLSCYLESIPVLILDRKYKEGPNGIFASFYETRVEFDKDEFNKIKDEKILLLTQQSDPGITLKEMKSVLEKSGLTNIEQCAVLKSNKSCNKDIRFCAYQYSSEKKCKKFPWEKLDTYKDIMR